MSGMPGDDLPKTSNADDSSWDVFLLAEVPSAVCGYRLTVVIVDAIGLLHDRAVPCCWGLGWTRER